MRINYWAIALVAFLVVVVGTNTRAADVRSGAYDNREAYMLTKYEVSEWLELYKAAWQNQDADLVAALFSETAHYAVNPLENILAGREAIKDYWRAGAAGSQKDIKFDYETWAITEDLVIVHWTASFTRTVSQERVKMDGVFRLVFERSHGQHLICTLLEEWWFLAAETL